MKWNSHVEEDRGFVGEHLLLNAQHSPVHRVVHVGQVVLGGALTHSSELVVHGTVAQTHPTLVGSKVRNRDAAQVSANGRANQNHGVSRVRERRNGGFVESGGIRKSIRFFDLGESQSTHEDKLSIPGSLKALSRGKLRDINLFVRVTNITNSGNHLLIEACHEGLHTQHVVTKYESLNHVHLSSLDLIVSVFFVPESRIEIISKGKYLFSSNQLSTLVLVSMGSPKLEGREEVTQNLFSSLTIRLLINFLFFLSLYSCMIPKFLLA